jgi:hypothetical protein
VKPGKPLQRRTPLKAKTPLAQGDSQLKRTELAPIGAKGRASRARDNAQVKVEGSAFRAAISGERCAQCGCTEQEAWDEDGAPLQAHHAVPQQRLKRLGLHALLWDPRNAVALCASDHMRHTSRHAVVAFERLPVCTVQFATEHGLLDALLREHPRKQVA